MPDISYYLTLPYTKVLRQDEEGDIVATIAELDGCMADGADESEALSNLRDAQAAWIQAALAAGQDIPAPQMEDDPVMGTPRDQLIAELQTALHRYGQHDGSCPRQECQGRCSCGLSRLFDVGDLDDRATQALKGKALASPASPNSFQENTMPSRASDPRHGSELGDLREVRTETAPSAAERIAQFSSAVCRAVDGLPVEAPYDTVPIIQQIANQRRELIELRTAAPVPSSETASTIQTRHGGNVGTTPFYLFVGQREPEYDQGDSVVVWYDDLYDLVHPRTPIGSAPPSGWQAIETCPNGYDGERFNYVLFRGTSRGRSFEGYAYVSGFMDSKRQPVHSYSYKLDITEWMPLPAVDPAVSRRTVSE